MNPAIKAVAGFCGSNNKTTKATIAITHQGKYKPATNEVMEIINIVKIKRIFIQLIFSLNIYLR